MVPSGKAPVISSGERAVCHETAMAHPYALNARGSGDKMEMLSSRNSDVTAVFKNRPAWEMPSRNHWLVTATQSNYRLCLAGAVAMTMGAAAIIINYNTRRNRASTIVSLASSSMMPYVP